MRRNSDNLIAKFPLASGPSKPGLIDQDQSTGPYASSTEWQRQLASTLDDLPSLLNYIDLDIEHLIDFYQTEQALETQNAPQLQTQMPNFLAAAHSKQFPLRVPRAFADRIAPNSPGDPLLRQVLPLPSEQTPKPGYVLDPLAERNSFKGQGFLQKYSGRILVVAHGSCAVHCRYCFRRHFPYDTQQLPPQRWQALANLLAKDKTIDEVILSGGDPLTLKNRQLEQLNPILAANPHVKRLRIHTRFPIMIPERLDPGFEDWLRAVPVPVAIVFHVNHAQEIDDRVATALRHLKAQAGIMLLNQSVLLRGVNDTLESQVALQQRLMEVGILPYYLHLLDPILGAHHFDVPQAQALDLVSAMQKRLPGYLVPRLVREEPGADSKTPIFDGFQNRGQPES